MSAPDIKKLIKSTIKNDSTIQLLLGGTPADPRIYPYYQPKVVISTTQKAFITYSLISAPEPAGAVENPVYSMSIWALDWTTAEDVEKSLMRLFNKKRLTTASPESRAVYSKRISVHDQFQEQTDFSGKVCHFRIGYSPIGETY